MQRFDNQNKITTFLTQIQIYWEKVPFKAEYPYSSLMQRTDIPHCFEF
jgi:hypothetical protein